MKSLDRATIVSDTLKTETSTVSLFLRFAFRFRFRFPAPLPVPDSCFSICPFSYK